MKIIISFIIFLLSHSYTNAQVDTIIYTVDYFSWNNLDNENSIHTNQLNNNHRIIRHFFKHQPYKIKWEIIEVITDSQYLYLAYNDSSLIEVESGILKVSHNYIEDTLVYFHAKTFEKRTTLVRRKQLIKKGYWLEQDSLRTYEGFYKNNHKNGEWLVIRRDSFYQFDRQCWIFENGNLLSKTQLNFIKTKDRDKILYHLAQNWNIQNTIHSSPIRLQKVIEDDLVIPFWLLSKDGTLNYYHSDYLGHLIKREGAWHLKDDFSLELKFNNNQNSQTYIIEYLLEDYLQLSPKVE